MPGMIEVAQATVTIIPTMKGAQQTITKELTGAGEVAGTAAGRKTGSAMAASFGKSMTSAGKTMTAAVTVPVAAMGKAAFSAASDFETSFAQLTTIADTSSVSIDSLRGGVMSLSNELGISSSEISAAAYSAISAGQDTADALDFVTSAAKLARGGFTDVSTATDVLTTALNAYELSAKEVTHVSDVLIQTQNEGKTTVDELAASMGRVIPTAANVNVGLEDLASQYVALTKNGIGTAEATTYINSMLNELGRSGTTAFDTFAEAAGMTFPEYIAAGHSTTEAMEVLAAACEATGLTVSDAFGSAEAGKAANTLVQHADDSTTALGNMATMAGQTEAAYATMSDTSAIKMQEMQTRMENLAITIGGTLLPMIVPVFTQIASLAESLSEKWNSLDSDTQQLIATIAGIAAVAGPILIIGGQIAGGISSIMGLVGGLGGTISGVVGHISSGASSLGNFASSATEAASGAASAATSFGTLAGQALLLIAAGAAVYIIAQAMQVLVNSAIQLANAGPLAIAVFVGIAAVAVGVTAAIVAIGSAATVSAVGLLAMGAAVLMISGGMSILVLSLAVFCGQLPTIAEYGGTAAQSLVALAEGMALMAAGSAATAAWTVTVVAAEVALVALLAELLLVDGELVVMAGALSLVSGSMEGIADSARSAADDMRYMVSAVDIVDQFLSTLKDTAGGVVVFVVGIFSSGTQTMNDTVSTNVDSMATKIQTGAQTIQTTWTGMFSALTATTAAESSGITSTWSSTMSTLSSTARTEMAATKTTIQTALQEIQNLFASTQLSFNQHVTLPHFSMSGSFDAETGSVPTVDVSWYRSAATQGARFSSPSIIGVGDASQPELLIGERTLYQQISEAVGSGGDTIIPVYLGGDLIDTLVVKANQRNNYRSGGRS